MNELEPFVESVLHGNEAMLELPHDLGLEEIAEALEDEGWFVTLVDRAPVFDKVTLLHALYQNCWMPAYFGFNWDALQDALMDFGWLEANGFALVFRDFALLQARAPEVAETFLEIARDTAQARRETERAPLCLLLALGEPDEGEETQNPLH